MAIHGKYFSSTFPNPHNTHKDIIIILQLYCSKFEQCKIYRMSVATLIMYTHSPSVSCFITI